jgi:hypothetical protein
VRWCVPHHIVSIICHKLQHKMNRWTFWISASGQKVGFSSSKTTTVFFQSCSITCQKGQLIILKLIYYK